MTELVSCPVLRVPAKASLECTPAIGRGIGASSDLQVCRLSCSAGSEFITLPVGTAGTGGNITTWCGAQTGFRWLHQLQNITLPSCSGIVPLNIHSLSRHTIQYKGSRAEFSSLEVQRQTDCLAVVEKSRNAENYVICLAEIDQTN